MRTRMGKLDFGKDGIWWLAGLGLGAVLASMLSPEFRARAADLVDSGVIGAFLEMVKSGYQYLCS